MGAQIRQFRNCVYNTFNRLVAVVRLSTSRLKPASPSAARLQAIELSPSREADSCSATQEFPNILWNPQVHYRVHKSPLRVPILSRVYPVCTNPFCLSKICFLITTHLLLGLPSGFFPSDLPTQSSAHSAFFPMRATCSAHNKLGLWN
jgi:hypothetical protein